MAIPPSVPINACPKCGEVTHWHGEIIHCGHCNWRAVGNPNATTFHQLLVGETFVVPEQPDLVLIKIEPVEANIQAAAPILPPGQKINAQEAGNPEAPWVVTPHYPVIRARDRRICGMFSFN